MRINKKIVSGILFLLAGLVVYWFIPLEIPESDTPYGPRLFPQITAIIMVVASLAILIDEALRIRLAKKAGGFSANSVEIRFNPRACAKTLVVFCLMGGYIGLFEVAGFLVSSLVYVLGCQIFFRVGIKRWWYYAVMGVIVLAIYYFFTELLGVSFPGPD